MVAITQSLTRLRAITIRVNAIRILVAMIGL
jgi:hypothetical protein